jgi:hypothetical protein
MPRPTRADGHGPPGGLVPDCQSEISNQQSSFGNLPLSHPRESVHLRFISSMFPSLLPGLIALRKWRGFRTCGMSGRWLGFARDRDEP